MSDANEFHPLLEELRFFASPEHPCSYLADRMATTIFVDPTIPLSKQHYSVLSRIGFRRSGDYVYRPHCQGCHACIPVRIPVAEFKPSRSQRRTLQCNRDLQFTLQTVEFNEAHYQLYRRYMSSRHPGGGMDKDDRDAYERVMHAAWGQTWLFEFRLHEKVIAVAIVDELDQALSAVYTFFEPDLSNRSLGTLAILQQIAVAREQGLGWVYLGYWIKASPKMAYKARFRPLEAFDGERWVKLDNLHIFQSG